MSESKDTLFSIFNRPDGEPPLVCIGLTPEAWKDLANKNTKAIDLRQAGVHIQLLVYAGETYEELADVVKGAAADNGATLEEPEGN
jgi:hypothetical protein